jgi:hypothetical protein
MAEPMDTILTEVALAEMRRDLVGLIGTRVRSWSCSDDEAAAHLEIPVRILREVLNGDSQAFSIDGLAALADRARPMVVRAAARSDVDRSPAGQADVGLGDEAGFVAPAGAAQVAVRDAPQRDREHSAQGEGQAGDHVLAVADGAFPGWYLDGHRLSLGRESVAESLAVGSIGPTPGLDTYP